MLSAHVHVTLSDGGGSTHPPPVYDDGSSKPLKKRKKPNPQPDVKSGAATARAESTVSSLATPSQTKIHDGKQLHKEHVPASSSTGLSHAVSSPPPLQVQHSSIQVPVLDMKKNLHKPPGAGSPKSNMKARKATRRRWTPAEDEAVRSRVSIHPCRYDIPPPLLGYMYKIHPCPNCL